MSVLVIDENYAEANGIKEVSGVYVFPNDVSFDGDMKVLIPCTFSKSLILKGDLIAGYPVIVEGKFECEVLKLHSGGSEFKGDSKVHGYLETNYPFTISSDFTVKGSISSSSDIISKDGHLKTHSSVVVGSLQFKGDIVVKGNLVISGRSEIEGDLSVFGSIESQGTFICDNLFASSDIYFEEEATIKGNLKAYSVSGSDDISVSGNCYVNALSCYNSFVKGDLECSFLSADSSVEIGGKTKVSGNVSCADAYVISEKDFECTGYLVVDDGSSFKSLKVGGDATLYGSVSVDNLSVSGNLTMDSEADIKSLDVKGKTFIDGKEQTDN